MRRKRIAVKINEIYETGDGRWVAFEYSCNERTGDPEWLRMVVYSQVAPFRQIADIAETKSAKLMVKMADKVANVLIALPPEAIQLVAQYEHE